MSTQITAAEAKTYINNYRKDLPAGAIKSAWLNKDVIDAIIALSSTHELDGIRVYMAKYTAEADTEQSFSLDNITVIVVPTEDGKDVDAYFDYSKICPPHCDGDIDEV